MSGKGNPTSAPNWEHPPNAPGLIEGTPETVRKELSKYQREYLDTFEAERREKAGQQAYEIDENGNKKFRGTTTASLVDGARLFCDRCKKPALAVQGAGPGRMLGKCCEPNMLATVSSSATCPTCAGSGRVAGEAIS